MSYSRWGSSEWYTFWRVFPEGQVKNRNTAIFEICGVKSFTAKQLRSDLDGCLESVRDVTECKDEKYITELKRYIDAFLKDVDNSYPKYEGKYKR